MARVRDRDPVLRSTWYERMCFMTYSRRIPVVWEAITQCGAVLGQYLPGWLRLCSGPHVMLLLLMPLTVLTVAEIAFGNDTQ